MKHPKLKYARLCRILTYVIVLGVFATPVIIICLIKGIPDFIKIAAYLGASVGCVAYIFRNFITLMSLDTELAVMSCESTVRTQYDLPSSFSPKKKEKRLSAFGTAYPPSSAQPQPNILQYKLCHPITIYSCGIEKVIASYRIDFLDNESYASIYNSAIANSKALRRKEKLLFHFLLDKNQRKAPLHRVTVVIVFAERIDEGLRKNLFRRVSKHGGNDENDAIVPCVIDLEKHICIFDSMRSPYIGFEYPAQNRGIRLIKKYIFSDKLPLSHNTHFPPSKERFSPEDSLWDLWSFLKAEDVMSYENANKEIKRFNKMSHGEVLLKGSYVYVKYEKKGIRQRVWLDKGLKHATVEKIVRWAYPNESNKIAKETVPKLEEMITKHLLQNGCSTVLFSDYT